MLPASTSIQATWEEGTVNLVSHWRKSWSQAYRVLSFSVTTGCGISININTYAQVWGPTLLNLCNDLRAMARTRQYGILLGTKRLSRNKYRSPGYRYQHVPWHLPHQSFWGDCLKRHCGFRSVGHSASKSYWYWEKWTAGLISISGDNTINFKNKETGGQHICDLLLGNPLALPS